MKKEKEIFLELSDLCISKGYPHVIAFLCFRDNTIKFSVELSGNDFANHYSQESLLRIEISTLIGLMVKKSIDYSLPTPLNLQKLIDSTDSLLHELHLAIAKPLMEELNKNLSSGSDENLFKKGSVMREPILYSGESAYNFQYREFAPIKFRQDDEWLKKNMGFSIDETYAVVMAIVEIQNRKLTDALNQFNKEKPENRTFLSVYYFILEEVVEKTGIEPEIIKRVISAFTLQEGSVNKTFQTISDFNEINATPILKISEGEYLLFQQYSLTEAFYESPFFWMINDKKYKDESLKHRGEFTEIFAENCLSKVFGSDSVFKNVTIYDSNKNKAGEIDVLVVYADRAIVVQAKSKKLTIEARNGNEKQLNSDFKAGIQDAYNQGHSCSELLQNKKYSLKGLEGELNINRSFKEIYIFCVISDHFPALTFQSFQKLIYTVTEKTPAPFVMDVFHLDVMSEMLNSPLYFLSYVKKRLGYAEKLVANNEGAILSYHLLKNLWVEKNIRYNYITDGLGADLEAAMLARRELLPGKSTPEGILTNYKNTSFQKLIKQIEKNHSPILINLGLNLLQFDEDTVNKFNIWIGNAAIAFKKDGKNHDFTMFDGDSGITVHCNRDPLKIFEPKLTAHVTGRKYVLKANQWFGLCVDPLDYTIRYVLELNDPWKKSEEMERVIKTLPIKS
ncbi:MAG: nuclease-related domain-containing protein [Balneolaceae bacterium]